jgi:hypothetical protein
MAVQQTVQIIGSENNTIAEVTTNIDAMLETPKACSLQASAATCVSATNSYPQFATDQPILSLRWEDTFSNAFIKKIRFGFAAPAAGTATVFTCKLFRVNNFVRQYASDSYNTNPNTPAAVPIQTLRDGQTVFYSGTGGGGNATDNIFIAPGGSLVSMPTTPSGANVPSAGLSAAISTIDPIPLAAMVLGKRAVGGSGPGFNTGGFAGNMPMQSLWEISEGDYPIYLRKGEGIIVTVSGIISAGTLSLGGTVALCFDSVPITNQEY